MSHFIVEYMYDGKYMMETLMGVEDIDLSHKRFEKLMGVWRRCWSLGQALILNLQGEIMFI